MRTSSDHNGTQTVVHFKETLTPLYERRNTVKNQEKDTRIYLRISQAEKDKIVTLAKSCGLTSSEYLRKRALGYAPRAQLPDTFHIFYTKLSELCNMISDKVTPQAEEILLNLVTDIQKELLMPKQLPADCIRREASWQPPDFGPSKAS